MPCALKQRSSKASSWRSRRAQRAEKKKPLFRAAFSCPGAGNRNRTYDLIITNDALYQLSYSGRGAQYSHSPPWRQRRRGAPTGTGLNVKDIYVFSPSPFVEKEMASVAVHNDETEHPLFRPCRGHLLPRGEKASRGLFGVRSLSRVTRGNAGKTRKAARMHAGQFEKLKAAQGPDPHPRSFSLPEKQGEHETAPTRRDLLSGRPSRLRSRRRRGGRQSTSHPVRTW